MKRKMNPFQIIVSITILCLISCKSSVEENKELPSLINSLRLNINSNNEILNRFKIQMQSRYTAKPYYDLATSLNRLIESSIDTTLSDENFAIELFSKKLNDLNVKYQNIIDSIIRKTEYKLFLSDDEAIIKKTKFVAITSINADNSLNQYLTYQDMLAKHNQVLKIVEYGIYTCYDWLIRVENTGTAVNVLENDKNTKVKMYYRCPRKYAMYELIDLVNLENGNNKKINYLSKEMQKDTLIITFKALPKSNYKASLKYFVTKDTGDSDTTIVEIPFTIW